MRKFILLCFFPALYSCSEQRSHHKLNADSVIALVGIVSIDTHGTMLMENKQTARTGKITLVATHKDLKHYMESCYNSYLYLRKTDEKFYVRVDGNYIDKSDSVLRSPVFLYNFVAILDEEQAVNNVSE
jgi:hypothetical protein